MNQQNNMGTWGCAVTEAFLLNFTLFGFFFIFPDIFLDLFQSFYNCLMQTITYKVVVSAKTKLQKCEKTLALKRDA